MMKKRILYTLSLCLLIPILLTAGCASICKPQWGFMPDESSYAMKEHNDDAKANYLETLRWAKDIKKTYSFRAGLNRISNYIAAGVGVTGGAAVTAFSAIDKSDTDTAKIVPIATALIAGIFAFVDNDGLAYGYLEACRNIDTAISDNRPGSKKKGAEKSMTIEEAALNLAGKVNEIINTVEEKRVELSNPPNATKVKAIETVNKLIDKVYKDINKKQDGNPIH